MAVFHIVIAAWLVVMAFIASKYVRDRRASKAREAARLGSLENRTPHIVRMLDGRFAVRRWADGRWEFYGVSHWWPAIHNERYLEHIRFWATPSEAMTQYQTSAAEQEAREAVRNDIGHKVSLTND